MAHRPQLLLGVLALACIAGRAEADDTVLEKLLPGTMELLKEPQSLPDRVILITGRQYAWEIDYARAGEEDQCKVSGTLAMPQNENVELMVTSDDVIHELVIPDLDIQVDAIPGRLNSVTPDTSNSGRYVGRATAMSGSGYGGMTIDVAILGEDEFDAWMQQNLPRCVAE